jgi:RNA polymerase sigma factor (sigma-70 family)
VVAASGFALLYAEQSPRVRRALVLAGADRELAADVAQEAFARTYAHWRRVRAGSNPAGYVFRVAFRELRRRGRLPDEPDGDEAASGRAATDGSGPEEQALAAVAAGAARGAIAAMPPRRRACALLVLVAGLSAEEAGQALGIAPSTVRVQVHRARAEVRLLPALAAVAPDTEVARMG